jgi:uncharacterized protein YdeI (YjbR/CyaY-like superfamily)
VDSDIHFFATPGAWRAWLEKNHAKAQAIRVGFYKRGSGRPTITWPESVDEALCFGWIDGVRRSVGPDAYEIRFTPRKPTSIWSAINVKRVAELQREGRMTPAGREAFERRREAKTAIYAYEQRKTAELPPEMRKKLFSNRKARAYFESRPPSYRHLAAYWILSAKKEATRERRLQLLIECSAEERPVPPFVPRPGKS